MEKCPTCKEDNPKCQEGGRLFSAIAPVHDAITERSQFHLLPQEQQETMRFAYWKAVNEWYEHIGLTHGQ